MGSARSTDRVSAEISVLVVEDDAPTRWRIVDALSRDGEFRVTDAANLAEARLFLANSDPDVLLTDQRHGTDPRDPPAQPDD